jgi:hypothetical protein
MIHSRLTLFLVSCPLPDFLSSSLHLCTYVHSHIHSHIHTLIGGRTVAEIARAAGHSQLADILAQALHESHVKLLMHHLMWGRASSHSFDSLNQRLLALWAATESMRSRHGDTNESLETGHPAPGNSTGRSPGGECVVCLSACVEVAIEPCGHAVLCTSCATSISSSGNGSGAGASRQCPVCRTPVKKTLRIFL